MAPEKPPTDPPKKRKGSITREEYDHLADLYLVQGRRTTRTLQRASGLSYETCLKAIGRGWPERNWASLRERAELMDRQARDQRGKAPSLLTPEEVEAMKVWRELKSRGLNVLAGVIGNAAAASTMLRAALERATADRLVSRRRVVMEVRGVGRSRREVPRTVVEDVVQPPSLTAVAQGIRAVGELIVTATNAQRSWLAAGPGAHVDAGKVEKAGWDSLTEEQQQFIIDNDGKLPEGVTREMLGRGAVPGA